MPNPNLTPIASMEAEQAVLASILIRPTYMPEIIELIRPEDFYRQAHGKIYQAMIELFEKDVPIDLTTVFNRLSEKKQAEEIGGAKFLMGLSDNLGGAANIHHYARIVHDKSTIRRLQEIALTIANDCQSGNQENVSEFIERAKFKINEIYEGVRFKGGKNIAKRVREYFEVTEGNVGVTDIQKNLKLVTTGNKKAALMALGRLVKEGYIARIKPGYYRVVEKDVIRLRMSNAHNLDSEVDLRYPFGIERWFVTYPKTIILISGQPDAGKTAMMLNMARMNMHLAPEYYWTSEMGEPELYSRVENFEDFNAAVWDEKVEFHERSENFADVVSLYPDSIHYIDNLEMNDEFWKVGGFIDAIWKALNRGVAIIGLHIDPGKEFPLGGMGAIKRARLWMDLKPKKGGGNIMEIRKFKNWRDKLTNIKNKTFEYSLVRGVRIQEWE